jgi:hypothetical protein
MKSSEILCQRSNIEVDHVPRIIPQRFCSSILNIEARSQENLLGDGEPDEPLNPTVRIK